MILVEPAPPQTILGQASWQGNPPTKKNRPMVINLVRNAGGNNRRLDNFFKDLLEIAEAERERYFRFLEMLHGDAEEGRRGEIMREIDEVLAQRGSRSRLLAELDSACGEGGLITHVLPSEDYRDAAKIVVPQLRLAWQKKRGRSLGGPDEPLHVIAHFYLGPRQRPDLLSLKEACADLLQEAEVLTDDKWIESWDGSRRFKHDRLNPRTEVTVLLYEQSGGHQQCLFDPKP